MLNKSTSRSKYVIQSGVTQYPIGFAFQHNGDGTPQIRVTIGDMVAEENVHFIISKDLLNIELLSLGENDKWVGSALVIERDIPFVQESDYQVGRISPEQIEKDFDLSVMRDQMLADEISERADDVQGEINALGNRVSSIEGKIPESVSDSNPLVVKDTLNGYVKKSGDTVDGDIRLNGAGVQFAADETDRVRAIISWGMDGLEIKTGVAFADRYYFNSKNFYAPSGIKLGTSSNPWTIAYIQTLNNGSDISVPAEGGTLARVEDLTDFAKKGDLSGYLPLTGKSFLSAWLGFDFVGEPGGNHAIIAAQTLNGIKGVAAIELDSEGRPTDILYVPKLKCPMANISVLLGTRIGSATTPIRQIHALKIGTGLSSHMLDVPDGPGTLARIEDVDGCVKKSGDTMTGFLTFEHDGLAHPMKHVLHGGHSFSIECYYNNEQNYQEALNFSGAGLFATSTKAEIKPYLGHTDAPWYNVYAEKLNNGADIAIPTEGGTLARIEDLSGYLPLSGGTLTGPLTIDGHSLSATIDNTFQIQTKGQRYRYYFGSQLWAESLIAGGETALGVPNAPWGVGYVKKLNNGADLAIPTEGGTLARVEDINTAVGDISTALTAILGE